MISFLFYKETFRLKNEKNLFIFRDFGAKKGSKLQINITKANSNKVFIGICNESEIKTLWNPFQDYKIACKTKKKKFAILNATINTKDETIKTIKIPYKGIVTPIIIPCDRNNITAEISISFNAKREIDFRLIPIKGIAPTAIFILVFVLFFYVIIVSTGKALFILLHIPILFCLVSEVLINVSFLALIYSGTINEHINTLLIMNALQQSFLFVCFYFVSSGIGFNTIAIRKFPFLSFLLGFFTVHSYYLTFFIRPGKLITLYCVLCMFAVFVELSIVYRNEQRTEMKLIAYQNVIMSEGIESSATPVRKKLIAYYRFNYCFLFYMILKTAIMLLDVFFSVEISFIYLANQILDCFIIITLLINFMPFNIKREVWENTLEDTVECKLAKKTVFIKQTGIQLVAWTDQKLPLPPLLEPPKFKLFRESEDTLL